MPYALKPKVGKKIEQMLQIGILKRVNYSESTLAIVVVPKKDGDVRICSDFRVTVNKAVNVDQYPLPRPEDIFAKLAGGTIFAVLDMSGAYQQLKHEDKQQVQQLLQVYNQAKMQYEEQSSGLPKNPLVILEGLDGSGKTSMTKQLAKKFKAEKRCTPPESIKYLRDYFDKEPILRPAYYSLGNYIAALEILCVLPNHAVVMDRYWHSTTAYALAQGVANRPSELQLPDPSDEIYKWPEDLLKPDKVIFLSVSEEMRLERHSRRAAALVTTQENLLKDNVKFRGDVIQAYKNMRDPAVTIIDGDGKFGVTLWKLRNNLKSLLENTSGNV